MILFIDVRSEVVCSKKLTVEPCSVGSLVALSEESGGKSNCLFRHLVSHPKLTRPKPTSRQSDLIKRRIQNFICLELGFRS